MRSHELPGPVAMCRVAIVAPTRHWRDVLEAVGSAGVVEPDLGSTSTPMNRGAGPLAEPPTENAVDSSQAKREAELDRISAGALCRGSVTALAGWAPAATLEGLRARLEPLGGGVAELPHPRGIDVPTALTRDQASEVLRPLVDTYATVPYRDVDPLWFAAVAYVVMFGMMFGDVGDGLLLVVVALLLRRSRRERLARIRHLWPLVLALGAVAVVFGVLYGEAFGPTGLVPTVWLSPLDDPQRLLVAGVGVGAVLLGCAYAIGIVNRWREGGPGGALWAPTGIAGAALFVGVGMIAAGLWWSLPPLWAGGLVVGTVGLALAATGLRAQAGPGGAGALQAGVETFDLTVRLGSNVVSFARLAAFGLMHAALAAVVWDATSSLWQAGAVTAIAALAVFVAGHAVAFALEALVAGVQALRLEYYELFSRVFAGEGRPFRPWQLVPDGGDER